MTRFIVLALVAGSLLPVAARTQTVPATQQGFAYCTITDTSSAQAKIWASTVFPLAYPGDDPGGFRRGYDVAGEFLAHVGTLGASGTKSCSVSATLGEAEVSRENDRATWSKRVYFIKIGDWRDVAWTPAPWKPGQATASAAPATRYFLCQATQTDIPDRSDRIRSVASGVFAMPVPGNDALSAAFEQAKAYAAEFQSVVQAHGLPVQGDCMPYDTREEAQYAYQQMLRLLKGFNQKYTEVAWTPTGKTIAPANAAPVPASAATPAAANESKVPSLGLFRVDPMTPALSESAGLPSPQGVLVSAAGADSGFRQLDVLLEIAGQAVNAPGEIAGIVGRLRPGFQAPVRVWRERKVQDISIVIPQPTAAATTAAPSNPPTAPQASAPATLPAEQASYCTAFVTRSKPALNVRAPARKQASPDYSEAAAKATLSALVAAVQRANPDNWHDLSRIECYDNSGVYAGEKFCSAATFKRFSGGMQMAGLFCNASRENIDKRWADMIKSDGGHAQVFPWPDGL